MGNALIDRILKASHLEGLLEVLGEQIPPTDLQSLLLEVFRKRAAQQTPARLLEQYRHNRFVQPAAINPQVLLEFDRLAYTLASPFFDPVELAPVSPLGVTSAVAPVDQNCSVATIRNTEVVSDPTNVLALECALRRIQLRGEGQSQTRVRLCTSHRLLRAQNFNRPGAMAHFRLFALVTAGRDEGGYTFEFTALIEQIRFYLQLLAALGDKGSALHGISVGLTDFLGKIDPGRLSSQVFDPLAVQFSDCDFKFEPERTAGRGYYDGLCFSISALDDQGAAINLGDGGITNWSQQLMSDKKERLLISGIGTERVCGLFKMGG
jgi:hypothetical protein